MMGRVLMENLYFLPIKVRHIYQETHSAICTKQNILAGIGVRALVEAVCSEKKAEGFTLEKKIEDLVMKGVLTENNAAVLHKTRLLGNKAAHETEPPSDWELGVGFDIAENLIETVYIIPKKAEKLT